MKGTTSVDVRLLRQIDEVEILLYLFAAGLAAVFFLLFMDTSRGVYVYLDARWRYLPVQATVLDSQMEEFYSSGPEGGSTSYIPRIRYRYSVGGEEFAARRYAHQWSTSDRLLARQVIESYPDGMETTAWYDPAQPEKAYLDLTQSGVWKSFVVLALLGSVAGLVSMAALNGFVYRGRLKRFLGQSSPPDLPWDIPRWGRLDTINGDLVLDSHYTRWFKVATFLPGFLAWIFVALFPYALVATYDFHPWVSVGAILFGIPFGLLSQYRFREKYRAESRLRVILASRTVVIITKSKQHELQMSDVESLNLAMSPDPDRDREEKQPELSPRLRIRTKTGGDLTVHTFSKGPDGLAVARNTAHQLAALLAKPVVDESLLQEDATSLLQEPEAK